MRRFQIIIIGLLLAGCDGRDQIAFDPPAKQTYAECRSLLPLRANQRTLLAWVNGRLFFHQPDANPELGLQLLEATGEVRSTQLTPARVGELLNAPFDRPVLRAIAALSDGRLVAYFNGTSRLKSLSCLVLFDPTSGDIRLIAAPQDLADVSGMGLTIDLADAQLERAETTIWLCLTHTDRSVFLRIDARAVATGDTRVIRAFDSLKTGDETMRALPHDRLSGQQDGSLWLLRPSTGDLWRISRDGQAFASKEIDGRPKLTVSPISLPDATGGSNKLTIQFYAMPDVMTLPTEGPTLSSDGTRYPALLFQTAKDKLLIDRDNIVIRPAFPTYALRFTHWVADPATGDLIAYDAMSGEVFRIVRTRR